MCEITKKNFKEKLPELKKSLQNAKFISVDLEFSALQPLHSPRIFDSTNERYEKLRCNLLNVIPLQVGLTSFQFNVDTDEYLGEVFTFYVAPNAFGNINKSFCVEASTLNFLTMHKFDFNKFAYLGVPYLSKEEVTLLRENLKSNSVLGENSQLKLEFSDVMRLYLPMITKWYSSAKIGDFLEIPLIMEKYQHFYEILYCIHKDLRGRFPDLWTYESGSFFVKKVSKEQFLQYNENCTLDEDIIDTLTGFQHVFNILASVKKPVIGHNVLQDLLIMLNTFNGTLPKSYQKFKTLTNNLFPIIFDTKSIYYELQSTIAKDKLPVDTSLKVLFSYFKDGLGRHLVLNSTAINSNLNQEKYNSYHDAGWDSYCTGYIFLRMAYYNVARNYPKNKKFVSSELINGLNAYKNRVNVIRGTTTHIVLDGDDPISTRPPWLIVESVKNELLDINDLMSTLNTCGFVDIKKILPGGRKAIVAVDNYRTARDISRIFKTNPKLRIYQYSALKHSFMSQAVLLTAVTVSGTFLIWLGYSFKNR